MYFSFKIYHIVYVPKRLFKKAFGAAVPQRPGRGSAVEQVLYANDSFRRIPSSQLHPASSSYAHEEKQRGRDYESGYSLECRMGTSSPVMSQGRGNQTACSEDIQILEFE